MHTTPSSHLPPGNATSPEIRDPFFINTSITVVYENNLSKKRVYPSEKTSPTIFWWELREDRPFGLQTSISEPQLYWDRRNLGLLSLQRHWNCDGVCKGGVFVLISPVLLIAGDRRNTLALGKFVKRGLDELFFLLFLIIED